MFWFLIIVTLLILFYINLSVIIVLKLLNVIFKILIKHILKTFILGKVWTWGMDKKYPLISMSLEHNDLSPWMYLQVKPALIWATGQTGMEGMMKKRENHTFHSTVRLKLSRWIEIGGEDGKYKTIQCLFNLNHELVCVYFFKVVCYILN